MGSVVSGITDAVGLTKTNRKAPSFSAQDAGFDQEMYDKLGERRDLYQRLVEGDIKDANGRPFGATAYDDKTAVDSDGNKKYIPDEVGGGTKLNPAFDETKSPTDASGNKPGDKAFDASTATQEGGLRGDVKAALDKYTSGQEELQDQMFGYTEDANGNRPDSPNFDPKTAKKTSGFLDQYDSATKGVMERIIGKDGEPGLADQYGTETAAFQNAVMGTPDPVTGERTGGIVNEFKESAGEITKEGGLIDQTKALGSGLVDKYQGAINPETGKREGGFLQDLEDVEKQFTDPTQGFQKELKDRESKYDATTGFQKKYQDQIDELTGEDGLGGELSGIKTDITDLKDELIGTKGEDGKRTGGVLGEVSQLQADLQDPSYLMEDQAMLAGLSEQQRAGEARASEESLRRQLAQSGLSPDETSGFLSRFKAMRDPLEESAAGDALRAAQQSQDQRRGMISDRQNLLSSKEALLQGGLENLNQQQKNVLAQAGLIDQESGLTDRQMGAQNRMDDILKDRMSSAMDVRNMMRDRMDVDRGLTMDQLGFIDREGQLRQDQRDALMDRMGMMKDSTMMGMTGIDREMDALDRYNRMNQGQFDTRSGALDTGSNFMGNIYQGTMGGLGDMYKYGTFGYQDARERMNAMDDARLAALGSKVSADMAQYNQPTGTQALVNTGIGFLGAL